VNDAPPRRHDATSLFAMPPGAHLIRCCGAASIVLVVFIVVYGGTDHITSLRDQRVRVDFVFEQNLPFVPELAIIYSSLYLLFLAIPFVLRSKREIWCFVALMTLITIVAGLCFLVMPAEVRFEVPTNHGRLPAAFRVADSMNLTYNLCPSLHVAYSVTCAEFIRRKHPRCGWPFHIWALAIAISAWLTYQHHLMDLVAGYVLSLAVTPLVSRYAYFDVATPCSA
jgi:membrane-associated phospholipid phosphatase